MILIIAGMIALTIAVAFWLAAQFTAERVHFQKTPDRPCSFGCSMAWLAIRSHDTEAVLEALRVVNPAPCNWSSGVGAVYDSSETVDALHDAATPFAGEDAAGESNIF